MNIATFAKEQNKRFWMDIALLVTILVEGYVVLAAELLSMRLLVVFVGSDTAIISIIVSAVLLPLSVGYYVGGKVYKNKAKNSDKPISIRKILIRNIIISAIFLMFSLSYIFLEFFFSFLGDIGIESRIMKTIIYSFLFLVTPVFLLGQTTPLISNYFSKKILSEITGRILFCSTVGSFMGAILTSLILMHVVGVHNTVILTMFMLTTLVLLVNKKVFSWQNAVMLALFSIVLVMNNDLVMKKQNIISNNAYSTIKVREVEGEEQFQSRELFINGNTSSKFTTNFKKQHLHARYIENRFISKLPEDRINEVLIIGAGGFALGLDDKRNNYTYVDVDGDLKEVSEKHFLKQNLDTNKKFVAEPARAFLFNNTKKFDLIILDVFSSNFMPPYQLVTVEYFAKAKEALKDGGVLVSNIIAKAGFADDWSMKIDNSFRKVFPYYERQGIHVRNPWNKDVLDSNVVYSYYHRDYSQNKDKIYTDNKNDYFLDK